MKIAVVIITYNQAGYICEALDGVFQQTRQADEIVIADDGSTDNTQQIILDYVKKRNLQDRCTLLLSEQNHGINYNLQNAIDHTTAEIIVGCAGDDVSLPNRLAETEALFNANPNVNHLVTAGYVINDQGKPIRDIDYKDILYTDLEAVIKRGMPPVGPFGCAWRRKLFDVFGSIPTDIPNEDDQLEFWGILLGGLLISSTKTYKYRVHGNSASSWLRNRTSNADFFLRFTQDQLVRHTHMVHWQNALNKVARDDQAKLISMVKLKAEFYRWLHGIESESLSNRLAFFLKVYNVLTMREMFYTIFGKAGIINWRRLRRLAGRF